MTPTTARSSSASASASSNSFSKRESVVKKKFACSFSGCGKCFSRSEHLHRHALNHKDGPNTCLRCMTHFRRRDLLDRHMARHKEKDDEAGGEGLGYLATRKKLWRDAEGKIVSAPRPPCAQESVRRRQARRSEKKDSKSMVIIDNGKKKYFSSPAANNSSCTLGLLNEHKVELTQNPWQEMSTLPSPPISEVDSEANRPNSRDTMSDNLETLYNDQWHVVNHNIPEVFTSDTTIGRQLEFPTGPMWASQQFQTFMGALGEPASEDLFRNEILFYEWHTWNNQMITSRCRDEKVDGFEEKKRQCPISPAYQEAMVRRGFSLGTC